MEKSAKIGIWGFGISGKASLNYIIKHHPLSTITIIDKQIKQEEKKLYKEENIVFVKEDTNTLTTFLDKNELIIPGPGIDLRPYVHYKHKFLSELDLFYETWKKPIIGITGTLGKTSITHLLSILLPKTGLSVATGGNIGIGMLDLIEHNAPYALLELSSFQLEHTKKFIADIAVITNIYPNHLDRHDSMKAYLQAKCNILIRQDKTHQKAIIPLHCALDMRQQGLVPHRPYLLFAESFPDSTIQAQLLPEDVLYYFGQNGKIYKYTIHGTTLLASTIPSFSYKENWLIIAAVLDALSVNIADSLILAHQASLPANRLEKITTINGVTFYNDSKSTIMQATIAACKTIKRPVVIIGGLSKGVDRRPFIPELKYCTSAVICFGAEKEILAASCKENGITNHTSASLEEAVNQAFNLAQANHCDVILSPGGASFDLFKDYKERGECFKNTVLLLDKTRKCLS